jgi:protein phosphatase
MRTDVGKVRRANEDSALVMPDCGVYAVADGMGGHNAGDVASRLAVESLRNRLRGVETTPKALQTAVQETNLVLLRRAQDEPAYEGMGTTLTLLCAREAEALIAHVGDSRCYLYRDGELCQCTQDHSVVAELMRQGVLTSEEARAHPYRPPRAGIMNVGFLDAWTTLRAFHVLGEDAWIAARRVMDQGRIGL